MDINELLRAHQAEVMKSQTSGAGVSDSHYEKIALYAERIRELRELRLGAQDSASATTIVAPPPAVSTDTVIYGTYAGDLPTPAEPHSIGSWESEGGSLDPPQVPLPDGVATAVIRQFFVGPYVYTDLPLALAEHRRQQSHAQSDPAPNAKRHLRSD
ncbi:hypothetical protein [Tsuneonella flava]|uniref:hypothetical protein n=1 Tax=Tsuneonella flava TaxID=2055955 RepID=UPI000F4D1767|nr:hypothetical protein [Tsuneonella flava]